METTQLASDTRIYGLRGRPARPASFERWAQHNGVVLNGSTVGTVFKHVRAVTYGFAVGARTCKLQLMVPNAQPVDTAFWLHLQQLYTIYTWSGMLEALGLDRKEVRT